MKNTEWHQQQVTIGFSPFNWKLLACDWIYNWGYIQIGPFWVEMDTGVCRD